MDEAIRLTHIMSKANLADETDSHGKSKRREDVMSWVFNIIRDYATTSQSTMLELKLCEAVILPKFLPRTNSNPV
jgi:hypothetical protein